jgi:predicted TPR repeat methyltransferase
MKENMYTDGSYLRNNPDWGLEDAPFKTSYILQLLNRNNVHPKHIVEIGCGAGGILEILSRETACDSLTGFDISPQAIAIAGRILSDKITFSNEDVLERNDYQADLLLVIDVLEHLDDFYRMLRVIRERSVHFIFHVPLDLSCRTILKPHVLLQQRRAVGHVHYFTKDMVEWMLGDAGYQVIDWMYTGSESDRGLDKSFKGKAKQLLRKVSFSINRDLSARLWGGYSMMILAK